MAEDLDRTGELIAGSSLGTEGARQLQARTPPAVADAIRRGASPDGLPPGTDIWVDFNGVDDAGCAVSWSDMARPGLLLDAGTTVTAGDDDGNTARAVVTSRTPHSGDLDRVTLRLDMSTFQPAPP